MNYTMSLMLLLFVVFAVLWFYVYNRFSVLYYHEQIQLFRFDSLYFRSYLGQLGGLSGYTGSFLTQFYFYPIAGSIIITCILAAVFLFFYSICRSCGNIQRLFFIPFIPAVLLMTSFLNIHFDMSSAVGILFALAGFRCYLALMRCGAIKSFAGFILFIAVYFVAGGNALLLTVLIFIFELTDSYNFRKILYLTSLIIFSVALPWVARQIFYIVPIREAYFALTPLNFFFSTLANKLLWISFPLLYLLWRLVADKVEHWNFVSWKALVLNCLLTVVVTVGGACWIYDSRAEMLNRMAFEVQHENWDAVMALSKAYPTQNRLVCYFTNIALAESGQMPYRMFQYRQVGVAGLFLDWQLNYFSLWHLGEVYYRLGIIPEAEHCAFEALVSSPKEPDARTMRRLVATNIARRDSATAAKYIGYFEHSFAYRKWAQQQRENLSSAMTDASFQIPDTPSPGSYDNFFINYQYPDFTLLKLLQSNPTHRLAFEYLMAFYMLQKNIEGIKWGIDHFFGNFDYPDIPLHYGEALIVYQNSKQADEGFFTQYPVSQATRERFNRYVQAFKASQDNRRNFEQLEKQFGDTYWFYVHFVEPSTLQKKDENNRY